MTDKLELLPRLYGKVIIPSAVCDELRAGNSIIDADGIEWLSAENLADPVLTTLLLDLDKGEAEVIALGEEMQADLLTI